MSIPVSCERCFQSFRVKDDFAGRTIRCKECGAAMAVPWDAVEADDDLIPSRPRKPKRKKRPSAAPKIAAIVIGCLCGIAVLGTGIWFAVSKLSERSISGNVAGTEGGSKESADGGRRSAAKHRIIVTGANWKPDPNSVAKLGQTAVVGDYELRLPNGARLVSAKQTPKRDILSRWTIGTNIGDTIAVIIVPNTSTNYEQDFEKHISRTENELMPSPLGIIIRTRRTRIERGRLNGWSSHRVEERWTDPDTGRIRLHALDYDFIDGKNSVLLVMTTEAPPGSPKYRLLETSLLSIRRR